MKPTHTPTPWKVVIKSSYSVHIESENAPESRLHIAKMDTYAGGKNPKFLEADAAFIVCAVNFNQVLINIAKNLHSVYQKGCSKDCETCQTIAQAESL